MRKKPNGKEWGKETFKGPVWDLSDTFEWNSATTDDDVAPKVCSCWLHEATNLKGRFANRAKWVQSNKP